MAAKKKPGVVKVSGGKEYKMVVARIEEFRTNPITKDWGIDSDFLYHSPDESCVIKATIYDQTRLHLTSCTNGIEPGCCRLLLWLCARFYC